MPLRAAALLHSLVGNHALVDGNKRLGWLATVVFLDLDDCDVELSDDAAFTRMNGLALRNTSLGNFLDRCAISLPAHRAGEAPVGFMLMGETGGDRRLFALAAAIERVLRD